MIELVTEGTWFDILERTHEDEPSPWERVCDHCGAHVASWDVVCLHCAWTLDDEAAAGPPPDDGDAEDVDDLPGAQPPPVDESGWLDQAVTRSREIGSWMRDRGPA